MISLKPLFAYLAYHKISKQELAEKSGVSYQRICKMRRDNTFNTTNLNKICTALNLNIKDVMRYEP